ncbi:hypothetical protein [Pantoea sp. UBA6567]|uniref:hypothetical protein n=1 Tax=Pantoea sp. UBA6567 TaxID=1947043 RepID=UPI00259522B9|nr:hypothetical protein [Pantoea sp. UBA6567]
MRILCALLIVLCAPSFAVISDAQRAANDLCEMEWRITDRSMSTHLSTRQIVSEEVQAFEADGHALSDYAIEKDDFISVSVKGAETYRKMTKGVSYPYADTRDFLRGRMMPLCIKNVLETLKK